MLVISWISVSVSILNYMPVPAVQWLMCCFCLFSSLCPCFSLCQSAPVAMQVGEGQQVQIVQAAAAQGQAQTAQAQGQTMQVMQQIITNTGEIQQIPVRDGSRAATEKWCEQGGGTGDQGKNVEQCFKATPFKRGAFGELSPFAVWQESSNMRFRKLTIHQRKVNYSCCCCVEQENGCDLFVQMTFALNQTLSPPCVGLLQVHLTNTGQLQYIRLAQSVSGAQVVQGQIQTLANTQQVITTAMCIMIREHIRWHPNIYITFLHPSSLLVHRSHKQRYSKDSSNSTSLLTDR